MITAPGLMLLVPLALQGLAILVDEFYFHHKRGLPRWEKLGHPLDTFVSLSVLLIPLFLTFSGASAIFYAGSALGSCLFVTKDEWVHAKFCTAAENWLHAILFLMHPLLFVSFGFMWWDVDGSHFGLATDFKALLGGQILIMTAFGMYQAIYWNLVRAEN